MKRVAIIGGGISGLTAAYKLRRMGLSVTVFEAEERPGGKVRGERKNGYLIEHGPNGWLADRTEVTKLAQELGLGDRIIRPSEAYSHRFVVVDDRGLLPVPMSPPKLATTKVLSLKGKARLLTEPFSAKAPAQEESIAAFGRRRIGEEASAKLLDALQTGIYAGDYERLSISACFPAVVEVEQKYGSLFRAATAMASAKKVDRALLTLPDGVAEITTALSQKLGSAIKLGHRVVAWRREGGEFKFTSEHQGGRAEHEADALLFAAPARTQAELLMLHEPTLAEKIRQISYVAISVVTLGYPRGEVVHPLNGFGFLCPTISHKRLLGVLFPSSLFSGRAPQDKIVLRCLIGGARDPMHTTRSNDDVIAEVRREVESLLQITAPPELVSIVRHDEAIPQYHVGHQKRVTEIEARAKNLPGLFLGGNAYRGVALYDCVRDAENVAKEIAAWLSQEKR